MSSKSKSNNSKKEEKTVAKVQPKKRDLKNTQLVKLLDYDVSNLTPDETYFGSIPGNKGSYASIPYYTINEDSTEGRAWVITEDEFFSFGASEFLDEKTGKPSSITMSTVMYDREGPTENQKRIVEKFKEIEEKMKNDILERKKELKEPRLDINALDKAGFLKYKKADIDDDGNVKPDSVPTIYSKVQMMKEKEIKVKGENGKEETKTMPRKIFTRFVKKGCVDENGNDEEYTVDELIGKRCVLGPIIWQIRSFFFGRDIKKCQIEMVEAIVEVKEQQERKLLHNKAKTTDGLQVVNAKNALLNSVKEDADNEDNDEDDKPKEKKKSAEKPKKKDSSKKEKKDKKVEKKDDDNNEEKTDKVEDDKVEKKESPKKEEKPKKKDSSKKEKKDKKKKKAEKETEDKDLEIEE